MRARSLAIPIGLGVSFSGTGTRPGWSCVPPKGTLASTGAIQAVCTQRRPFRFDRPSFALSKAQLEFAGDAMRHNRHNGFAVPLHGAVGLVGGFSVTGCKTRPTAEQMNRVMAVGYLLDTFTRVREKLQVASNPELLLKAHELDLL